MIRVLIADDHPVVRKGLKRICQEAQDIAVSGEAANEAEILEALGSGEYDVVLLDVSMPGKGGIEILRELKKLRPELYVLIVSMYPEEQYALRALRAGASGYLTKKSAPEELVTAIRKVAGGGRYISSSLAEELASTLEENFETRNHRKLSIREYEVMLMLASGKMVKEISSELGLSEKTVSTYRARILLKMNLRSNMDITRYAIDSGLLQQEKFGEAE